MSAGLALAAVVTQAVADTSRSTDALPTHYRRSTSLGRANERDTNPALSRRMHAAEGSRAGSFSSRGSLPSGPPHSCRSAVCAHLCARLRVSAFAWVHVSVGACLGACMRAFVLAGSLAQAAARQVRGLMVLQYWAPGSFEIGRKGMGREGKGRRNECDGDRVCAACSCAVAPGTSVEGAPSEPPASPRALYLKIGGMAALGPQNSRRRCRTMPPCVIPVGPSPFLARFYRMVGCTGMRRASMST